MKKLLLLTTAIALLGASSAFAQPGMSLSWVNCDVQLANGNLAMNCATEPATPNPAVVNASFVLASALPDFSAVQGEIHVVTAGASPDWWKTGTGECSDGRLSATTFNNFNIPAMCSNPYAGSPGNSGGLSSFPHSTQTNRRVVQFAWARAGDSQALTAGTRYVAVQINIIGAGTTGCAGCAQPATLVLAFMQVLGQSSPQVLIQNGSVREYAYWNGGVGPTAARNKTWGAIKSMYR